MTKNVVIFILWLSIIPLTIPTLNRGSRQNVPQATPSRASGDNMIDPVVQYWSSFVRARQTTTHFAYTGNGDHENAGVYTSGGGAYLGVEALHSVFKTGDFDLAIPAGAQGPQTLYAPTTRPPNGACLEVGTGYTTLPGQHTVVHVYVYNFCQSPRRFVRVMAVDDKFMNTYAREPVQGAAPAYKIMIKPDGNVISSRTKWTAMIYNYLEKRWCVIGSAQGYVASDRNGWSIFETWYKKGQCSQTLKILGASNIAYYNGITGGWEPISDDMSPLRNVLHHGGDCFMDQDANNKASYDVIELRTVHGWEVRGTGN